MKKIILTTMFFLMIVPSLIYCQTSEDSLIILAKRYQNNLFNGRLSESVDMIHPEALIQFKSTMIEVIEQGRKWLRAKDEDFLAKLPSNDSLKQMPPDTFFIIVGSKMDIGKMIRKEPGGNVNWDIVGAIIKGDKGYVVYEEEISGWNKSFRGADVLVFKRNNGAWKAYLNMLRTH
jgi:hypothetical protein